MREPAHAAGLLGAGRQLARNAYRVASGRETTGTPRRSRRTRSVVVIGRLSAVKRVLPTREVVRELAGEAEELLRPASVKTEAFLGP